MNLETLNIVKWSLFLCLGLLILFALRKSLVNAIKSNPTRSWPKVDRKEFVIDLSQETFQGIRFGDGIEKLQGFGLAACRRFAAFYTLYYHFCGLNIDLTDDRVDQFNFDFEKAKTEGQGGHVYLKNKEGNEISLGEQTSSDEIRRLLGAPLEGLEDEEGLVMEYAVPSSNAELSLGLVFQLEENRLSYLEVFFEDEAENREIADSPPPPSHF